jgi:hypothetical protein
MSKPIVLGTPGMIEQPKRYSGGPFKQMQVVRTWKGSKKAALDMIPKIAGWEWSIDESGPNATVSVVQPILPNGDPTGEVPLTTWELMNGEVEKDVLLADIFASNVLDDTNKKTLRGLLKSPPEDSVVIDNAWALATFHGSTDQKAAAFEMYLAMNEGTRGVIEFAPTLRVTKTVSSTYSVRQSVAHVKRVLTSATMIDDCSLPNTFLIALDGSPFTDTPLDTLRKAYGWLKYPPNITVASNGHNQITQEYKFGLWSKLLYDDPI